MDSLRRAVVKTPHRHLLSHYPFHSKHPVKVSVMHALRRRILNACIKSISRRSRDLPTNQLMIIAPLYQAPPHSKSNSPAVQASDLQHLT